MIFLLQYLLLIFGLVIAGIMGIVPDTYGIPYMLKIIMFMMGCVIAFVGPLMINGRANKTGVNNLIEPSKPNVINWLYVHKDGSIEITPSIREIEGTLYSPKLDAMIHEYKMYRIHDHTVRLVAEGHGHAADVGLCLYADYLKRKGFPNLKVAREFGKEYVMPEDIKKVESGFYGKRL